jgi:hypothetical protein
VYLQTPSLDTPGGSARSKAAVVFPSDQVIDVDAGAGIDPHHRRRSVTAGTETESTSFSTETKDEHKHKSNPKHDTLDQEYNTRRRPSGGYRRWHGCPVSAAAAAATGKRWNS